MKLHSLQLTNFKGQKNFTLTADGENVNIFGSNASGKTTLADAFAFLLFGKDSMNRADFEILPVGPDGERVKGVTQAEVEAVVTQDHLGNRNNLNTNQITIKRVYAEKWGQRGDQRGKLLGHTTDYYIDGVPLKEKEFKSAIEHICDEATFKLLTNPRYFCEVLKWQDRRTLLLRVCGDVTDEDVIASEDKLSELPAILKGRSLEDHRTVVQAAIQAINKTLAQIPVRIDEVNKGLPAEATDMTEADLMRYLTTFKQRLTSKQEERARLVEGNGVAEKESELLKVETRMLDIKNRHIQSINKQVQPLQDSLTKIKSDIEVKKSSLATKIKQRDDDIRRKIAAENERATLLEEYHTVDADTTVGTCTYCGQTLPQEKANTAKSKRLESILTKGKAEKSRIEQLDADMLKLDKEIEDSTEAIEDYAKIAVTLQGQLDDLTAQRESYAMTEDYLSFVQQQRVLVDEIASLKAGSIDTTAIDNAIEALNKQIHESENVLQQIRQRAAGMKRIDELMS